MISFNDYQKNISLTFLANECFNALCDVGIDPSKYLEWIANSNFEVSSKEIDEYVKNNFVKSEAASGTSRTPLQQAMKDPARKAMVQRALQSLQQLQISFNASLKRGGLLSKQPDLNKMLAQTMSSVKNLTENVNEGLGTTLDALGSGAMGAVQGFLSGGFKGMSRGAKAGYQASLDQAEINAATDAKNNLDTLINSLPDKNAPITKQLQTFNNKLSSIISPEAMQAAEDPSKQKQPAATVGIAEKVESEMLKAFEDVKSGKEPNLPSVSDKNMKQELVDMMKFSVPLKDGSTVEDGGVTYTYKNGKWYLPSPMAAMTGSLTEADSAKQTELNTKYPPEGKKNLLWDQLKDLTRAEKAGKLPQALSNFHNRLQKEPLISDKLRNFIVQMFKAKNESVYYSMDYTKYVDDLING